MGSGRAFATYLPLVQVLHSYEGELHETDFIPPPDALSSLRVGAHRSHYELLSWAQPHGVPGVPCVLREGACVLPSRVRWEGVCDCG